MSRQARPPVELLPPSTGSLARGVPHCPPGTLFVLSRHGGIRVAPSPRFDVVFGRDEPEVHVCIGEDDPYISRRHGLLHCDGQRWTLRNTGTVPIRFPGSQLLLAGQQERLPQVYTPLFIRTGPHREHVLEVRVTAAAVVGEHADHDAVTRRPSRWQLSDRERLAMISLGQRYLRHEPHPQPMSWKQVGEELAALHPGQGWTARVAEHLVHDVRARLAGTVPGLTRDEVGEPVGNIINHNLLLELLTSTTLVPTDLWELGEETD